MNKLARFVLLLAILTSQAFSKGSEGLKTAFDELSYALTVEWDQEDPNFRFQEIKNFHGKIEALKAKGLTNAEIVDFAGTQLKNEKVAKDLEVAVSLLKLNQLSTAEAAKYVVDGIDGSYNTGASWTGDTWVSIAVVAVIISVFVVVMATDFGEPSSSSDSGEYTCSEHYICDEHCDPAWEGSYIESCWYECRYVCI